MDPNLAWHHVELRSWHLYKDFLRVQCFLSRPFYVWDYATQRFECSSFLGSILKAPTGRKQAMTDKELLSSLWVEPGLHDHCFVRPLGAQKVQLPSLPRVVLKDAIPGSLPSPNNASR